MRAYQGTNMITSATATIAATMYMVRLVANRLRDDEVGTWPGVLGGGVFMPSSMVAAQGGPCRTSTGQGLSAGQDKGVGIGAWWGGRSIESHHHRLRFAVQISQIPGGEKTMPTPVQVGQCVADTPSKQVRAKSRRHLKPLDVRAPGALSFTAAPKAAACADAA